MTPDTSNMDVIVAKYYLEGFYSPKSATNPYSPRSYMKRFTAWSGGHWDRYGEVSTKKT